MIQFNTSSPEATYALGMRLGEKIKHGVVLLLEGDLGAGKTLFVQGLAAGLHVAAPVTSPTFNLMNVYEGKKRIYHFDLYRLEQPEDLEEIGFYEYTDVEDEVVLIEWPDRFFAYMPEDYLHLKIDLEDLTYLHPFFLPYVRPYQNIHVHLVWHFNFKVCSLYLI